MEWPPPPDALSLAATDVHVWRVDLDAPIPPGVRETLSADEDARARGFRFPHLTAHFVAARGALRAILSRYTGVAPADLAFTYSSAGKPSLAAASGGRRVSFNVSHAHGVGLCAVSAERDVGVDVEWTADRRPRFEAIDRYFSPAECADLRRVAPARRRSACYSAWTRKEAFLKARGEGLSLPLHAFDVTCAPDEPPRILATRGVAADDRRWTVFDLAPGADFAGTVVVAGESVALRCWRWSWR